jgi:hypothetical protein
VSDPSPAVDLHWIPLGAGAHVVRLSGKVYEALRAVVERRPRTDLYHSALIVQLPGGRTVIESAPIPDDRGAARGVVAEGPVGLRALARFRLFRYEVRCWNGGEIPDEAHAVETIRVAADEVRARRILELIGSVPRPVWGRDELGTGDMWNSNSVIAWVLVRSGIDVRTVSPPPGGRAPGWDAGLQVARRAG